MPFPEYRGFISTGASIHVNIQELRQKRLENENVDIRIHLLGDVPELWVNRIIGHVNKSIWHDRHAKDYIFEPEKVKQRRIDWIKKQLKSGVGFLTVVVDREGELGAYLMVPLDRSRVPYGGPIVAGINAVAGSIQEGYSFARKVILTAFERTKTMWDTAIIQFQPDNLAMSHIVNRLFFFESCVRYDIHWHSG